ncbi:Organic cation transporter protein [Nymphon striatum]|nr:Organic cation transporter protein [Nymphon striatum]
MTGSVALDQVDRYIYLAQLISIHRDWESKVRRRAAKMQILKSTIGAFGKWHVGLFLQVCALGFCVALHMLGMNFVAPKIDHWCSKPDNLGNVSDSEWKNLTMPMMSELLKWSSGSHRVVWELICEHDVLVSIANSVGMTGLIVGVFVLGQLSDRFGRRPVVLVAVLIWTIASAVTIFCEYYALFVVLRFICLGVGIGSFTNIFVILAECISDHERATWGNAKALGFAIGFMLLAGLGYGIRSWEFLQLAYTVPLVPVLIILYFYLPESPRWLLTNGKIPECVTVLENIMRVNKIQIDGDVDIEEKLNEEYKQILHDKAVGGKKNALDLIRTPKMRLRSFCMFFCWFVTSFVYYAQSMSAGDLGGNPHINFFLSGAVEIPATLLVIFVTVKFGRKKSLMFLTLVGGLGCLFTIPVPDDMVWLRVTFAMIGKFGMSANFPLIYIYASEIFPTPVRNVGVGTSSMFGRVGTAISPYVKEVALHTNRHVPQGIAGALALICVVLAWFLPETSNRRLPETIDEIEGGEEENVNGNLDKDEETLKMINDSEKI